MEHKLITGGEQWLPFARSRIKAMRATGLQYAAQKYEIDGDRIEVSIAGEHEYIQIGGGGTLYVETGQLSWPFRPRYSPLWGEAATWSFADIQTTAKWLGLISTSKETRGEQRNSPELRATVRSKAIGWPLAEEGSAEERAAADLITQEQYFNQTLTKKRLMGMLPTSVFSGKMRLFMQAVYGAKEAEPDDEQPFVVDDLDAPTLGMFKGKAKYGGGLLMIRPNSMGIFTAPDDTYWLLDINEGPRNVLTYKLNTARASSLVRQLKHMSDAERTKAEAYIFANCDIEIPASGHERYATGGFSMAPGSPLAYGFKWNSTGSRASIVHHEQLGETIPETRWHARTVHLSFGYAAATETSDSYITVSGAVEDHSDWIDGWGMTNIFVPGFMPGTMDLLSLRAGAGLIPPLIRFDPTPIYGWYVADAWTPVMLSNNRDGTDIVNSSSSGVVYPLGQGCPPHTLAPWAEGVVDALDSHSFTVEHEIKSPGYYLSFGGIVADSYGSTYSRSVSSFSAGGGGNFVEESRPVQWVHTSEYPYPLSRTPSQLGGVPYVTRVKDSIGGKAYAEGKYKNTAISSVFAIVFPIGDSEALYVPRAKQERGDITDSMITADFGGPSQVIYATRADPEAPVVWVILGEYFQTNTNGMSSYTGTPWSLTTNRVETSATTPFYEGLTEVLCFNRKVFGMLGKPGGSYGGLFDCDYRYPQYDRAMTVYTSYNGRYIMSEAPANPAAPPATGWHNFVGWI